MEQASALWTYIIGVAWNSHRSGVPYALIDALRESKKRERNEVSFSALTPQEEKQLYTVDKYFANEDEETFCAGGLKITAKLLADAMHSLPDEKRRTVLLYKLVIWMLD